MGLRREWSSYPRHFRPMQEQHWHRLRDNEKRQSVRVACGAYKRKKVRISAICFLEQPMGFGSTPSKVTATDAKGKATQAVAGCRC